MKKTVSHLIFIFSLVVSGCATLPAPPDKPHVYSLPPAASGTLNEVAEKIDATNGHGLSDFLLIRRNEDALKWRLALIDHATTAIDAQYFIWQGDETGLLLFDRLLKAADRGVRVRLLVDDLMFASKERSIASISTHPNFDIRLFNPGRMRGSALAGLGELLLNFRELNRRMHNKLLVVDNRLAIVGGRNIGNEYFGLGKKYNFQDLDAMVAGPVVEEVSRAFDEYWNADLAHPGSAMSKKGTPEHLQYLRNLLEEQLNKDRKTLAAYPIDPARWKEELFQLPVLMQAGETHFIQDTPTPSEDGAPRLVDMLGYLAEPSHKEIIIVTPYLIPVGNFLKDLDRLASEGVKVSILTGSMGANNHTLAHSHYKKYRRRLLAAGVDLYEFRHDPSPAVRSMSDVPPVTAPFISLHIKAIVGDRKRCFVGSLNIDPRAIKINTENGLYIESSEFCGELATQFEGLMAPENAWRVTLTGDNRLQWTSHSGTVSIQPARSFGQRIADFFFRLLPVENQL